MMLEIDNVWAVPAAGSSAVTFKVLKPKMPPLHSVLYCESSTLASTQSFAIQTAQSSAGPWFTEASTSVSATNNSTTCDALRLTGPFLFMRPKLNSVSTGTYTFRLVGVG